MTRTHEITMGDLAKGITPASESINDYGVWNILGHRYLAKAESSTSFSWLSIDPAGTGVPPHIHPDQDEFIYVLEGEYTLFLDGEWVTAGPGDTVRMPMGLVHAYYNKGEQEARSIFWVSPTGELPTLFQELHNVTDPEEVVRLSANRGVDFLPEGSVEGA